MVIGAIVGHAGKTITSRVYGKEAYKGAGLKVLAGYVEQISYPGLKDSCGKGGQGQVRAGQK